MSITVYPSSIASGESVNGVLISKVIKPSSITSGESVSALQLIRRPVPVEETLALEDDTFAPFLGRVQKVSTAEIGIRAFGHMYTEGVSEGSDDAQDDTYDGWLTSATITVDGSPVTYPTLKVAEKHLMNNRAIPVLRVSAPDPVVFHGRPMIPRVYAAGSTAHTANVVKNTDPDDSDDDSHVWKIGTLADPGEFIVPLDTWTEVGGGLSWNSVDPYRPYVRKRSELLDGETNMLYGKQVCFRSLYASHMWLDLGSNIGSFTVMAAVIIERSNEDNDKCYILDAGKSTPVKPTDPDRWGIEDYVIDDGLDHRAALVLGRNRSHSFNQHKSFDKANKLTKRLKGPRKPKIAFAVFDGADSFSGTFTPGSRKMVVHGSLPVKSYRYLVMGRANDTISQDAASDMNMFEIRIYERALSLDEVVKKSKRMMGRYKFDQLWD